MRIHLACSTTHGRAKLVPLFHFLLMCHVWFELVNFIVNYGHLKHTKTQTIVDKLCWKMLKTRNHNNYTHR